MKINVLLALLVTDNVIDRKNIIKVGVIKSIVVDSFWRLRQNTPRILGGRVVEVFIDGFIGGRHRVRQLLQYAFGAVRKRLDRIGIESTRGCWMTWLLIMMTQRTAWRDAVRCVPEELRLWAKRRIKCFHRTAIRRRESTTAPGGIVIVGWCGAWFMRSCWRLHDFGVRGRFLHATSNTELSQWETVRITEDRAAMESKCFWNLLMVIVRGAERLMAQRDFN